MMGTWPAAGLASFLAVAVLTPWAGKLASRLGLIDQPKSTRAHMTPTPYLGGLAIVVGLFGGLVAARGAFVGAGRQTAIILTGAVVMSLIGLIDDVRPHRALWRLLAEVAIAVALISSDVLLHVTPWLWLDIALTVMWIVGITNAMNLLDNMDGLASGTIAIAAAGAAFLAWRHGQELVVVMAASIAGAAAGFLVHNRPPARIFMGDAGSLPLGFLLAVTVAKLDLVDSPGPLRLAVVSMLCGVGILDTVLVVVSRLYRRISPMQGGTDHSSHRLVRSGLSTWRAVLALHSMSAWFVATAILARYARPPYGTVAVLVSMVIVAGALWVLFRLPAEGPLPQMPSKKGRAPEGALPEDLAG